MFHLHYMKIWEENIKKVGNYTVIITIKIQSRIIKNVTHYHHVVQLAVCI